MSLSQALSLLQQAEFQIEQAKDPEVERKAALSKVDNAKREIAAAVRHRMLLVGVVMDQHDLDQTQKCVRDIKTRAKICKQELERFEFQGDEFALRTAISSVQGMEFDLNRAINRVAEAALA